MCYANSLANPIIYAFSNESFKTSISNLIAKIFNKTNPTNRRAEAAKAFNEVSALL